MAVKENLMDMTQEFWALTRQVGQLTLETDSLKKETERLKEITEKLESVMNSPVNIKVDVEDIPFEKVKEKIYEYYKIYENEAVYPDEVADELGLDLKVTMEAVEELLKEDRLEVVE